MRIFDTYSFNVIEKVKFKDTAKYIDKMLDDLGLGYKNLGFRLETVVPSIWDVVLQKYPSLDKYYIPAEDNIQMRMPLLTSFSKDWCEGKIYVDEADRETVKELFTKIPYTYNIETCDLLFDGIDWYGDGNLEPITQTSESYKLKIPTTRFLPFKNNGIRLAREYDFGRKKNLVLVSVEATTDDEPRDTTDVLEKLKPYLGEPLGAGRGCMFSNEEKNRYIILENKYNKQLDELFDSMVPKDDRHIPYEPYIKNVVDKRTLNKAFLGTVFRVGERKGLLHGMNEMVYIDSHRFKYEILFDRSPSNNYFSFIMSIRGYNFELKIEQKDFGVTYEGESKEILAKIVRFCNVLLDEVADEIAKDFGDTPEWYRK